MNTNNDLLTTALQALGIDSLNAMQEAAISSATTGKDLVLLSPTGTGKTLAYLLPIALKIEESLAKKSQIPPTPQVLILAPSRELALQIETVWKQMTTPWKAVCCYGGHPISEEKKSILTGLPALIVGTPGRIADHLRKGNFVADNIATLVIDEFDKALELGFQDEMAEIIGQLNGVRQRILLSATDSEEIPQFVKADHATILDYSAGKDSPTGRLTFYTVHSPEKDKINTLYQLLCQLGSQQCIVFCNHREAAERVSRLLQEKKLMNSLFHGGMEQADRERALYRFRSGSCYVLVSTDLAARGLDIPDIANIIHYHLPINEEAFIHRNGRTARWKAEGNIFLIVNEAETIPDYFPADRQAYALTPHTPKPAEPIWTTLYIGKGKKDKLSKMDIAGFLYKKGGLNRDEVGTIDVRDQYALVAVRSLKVKQLLTLVQGEKIKGLKTKFEVSR